MLRIKKQILMSDLVVLNFIKNGCIKDARMFGWGHQLKGYLDTGVQYSNSKVQYITPAATR